MTPVHDKLNGQTPSTPDLAPNLALPWVVRLRYGIVCGEAAILAGMTIAFQLNVPLFWMIAALALVFSSNVVLGRRPAFAVTFPQQTLGAIFVLDTLCLTVLLGLTGGPANPFSLLYLVQITISAVVLAKAWRWALGALSTVCFGLLFPFHLPVPAFEGHHASEGLSPHLVGMWIAFIVAAGLITFFTGKVSDELREREQEVLQLQEKVSRNERLASLATLAAGAAHELGTPLGTIAIVSRELERYAARLPDGGEMQEDAKLIRSEVERCRLILERMSAEGAEPVGEAPRLIGLLDLALQTVGQFSESQRASIRLEIPDERVNAVLPVQAAVQSLGALIKNALDASEPDEKVIVRAVREGSYIVFSVCDTGQGMSEAVLRRIAEPFFTTKEPGKGMGLGTFLVRTFAERLGGELSFKSVPGKGTTATLHLPLGASGDDAYAV
jgi:two-component system, sensor histidine kinase RegB